VVISGCGDGLIEDFVKAGTVCAAREELYQAHGAVGFEEGCERVLRGGFCRCKRIERGRCPNVKILLRAARIFRRARRNQML